MIANLLAAEVAALKDERHAADVALRTMSQDVVRKADRILQLGAKLQVAEQKLLEHQQQGEAGGVDVHAEVEPETAAGGPEASTAAGVSEPEAAIEPEDQATVA